MSETPTLPAFFRLVALDAVDSTNEEARRLAAAGAPEGTLVWARSQSAGRGRRGRPWHSPRGNLYLSVLLRPKCAASGAAQIGFVTAVALGDTLRRFLPRDAPVTFKWPNDVLVAGRKASGILLEASGVNADRLDWVVVGVGINVAASPGDVPYAAMSLSESGAGDTSVAEVLAVFAGCFLSVLETWQREGFEPVRSRWLEHAQGLGGPVEVRLDHETLAGRFAALDEGGGLALDLPSGGRRIVTAGDVFFPHL